MAQTKATEWAFVRYEGEDFWHQRWVIGRVESSDTEYVTYSPDGEITIEELAAGGAGVAAIRWTKKFGRPPPGVPRATCYHFDEEPTEDDAEEISEEVMAVAKECCETFWTANPAKKPARPRYLIRMPEAAPPPAGGGGGAPRAGGARGGAPAAVGGGGPVGGGAAAALGAAAPAAPVAPVAPAVAVAAPAVAAAAPLGVGPVPTGWVLVESTAVGQRGSDVQLNGTEKIEGDIGLLQDPAGWVLVRNLQGLDRARYKAAESHGDVRMIKLNLATDGTRQLHTWHDGVKLLVQSSLAGWPIPGPRTTLWCCQFIARRQGGPMDHFRFWTSVNRLARDGWGVSEYEGVMRMIYYMVCWDGCNIADSAGVETAMRKCQLTEYTYLMEREGGSATAPGSDGKDGDAEGKKKAKGKGKGLLKHAFIDESAVFSGTSKEFGDNMIMPDLLSHVGSEIERDANVLKQVRKAREERQALRS